MSDDKLKENLDSMAYAVTQEGVTEPVCQS